jgi:Arc/MetJ family transcription regulator
MPNRAAVTLGTKPDRKVQPFTEVKRTRTTITLDDELIRKAQLFTGLKERSAVIREALTQLVEREGARRLAAIGGTSPNMRQIPRRRLSLQ